MEDYPPGRRGTGEGEGTLVGQEQPLEMKPPNQSDMRHTEACAYPISNQDRLTRAHDVVPQTWILSSILQEWGLGLLPPSLLEYNGVNCGSQTGSVGTADMNKFCG